MWVHKISLPFQTFMSHTVLRSYAMSTQFSAISKCSRFKLQIAIPELRYDLLCNLFPHTLFSHAQSHLFIYLLIYLLFTYLFIY